MARKPNLKSIETLMKSGGVFQLTASQYLKETGSSLPKSSWYLINRSALAQLAQKFGYQVKVQERIVLFENKI